MKGLLLFIAISIICIGVGWVFNLSQNDVEKMTLAFALLLIYEKLDINEK